MYPLTGSICVIRYVFQQEKKREKLHLVKKFKVHISFSYKWYQHYDYVISISNRLKSTLNKYLYIITIFWLYMQRIYGVSRRSLKKETSKFFPNSQILDIYIYVYVLDCSENSFQIFYCMYCI